MSACSSIANILLKIFYLALHFFSSLLYRLIHFPPPHYSLDLCCCLAPLGESFVSRLLSFRVWLQRIAKPPATLSGLPHRVLQVLLVRVKLTFLRFQSGLLNTSLFYLEINLNDKYKIRGLHWRVQYDKNICNWAPRRGQDTLVTRRCSLVEVESDEPARSKCRSFCRLSIVPSIQSMIRIIISIIMITNADTHKINDSVRIKF